MNLIETIKELSTCPRYQEDEYEYTSDFLEWFYYNLCKNVDKVTLQEITMDPEFECMREQCMLLLNVNNAKNIENDDLINKYENMKQWLINKIECN